MDLDFNITWPETVIGKTVQRDCPCDFDLESNALIATRTCAGNFESGARWMDPSDSPCDFSITARELCRLAMVGQNDPSLLIHSHVYTMTD